MRVCVCVCMRVCVSVAFMDMGVFARNLASLQVCLCAANAWVRRAVSRRRLRGVRVLSPCKYS